MRQHRCSLGFCQTAHTGYVQALVRSIGSQRTKTGAAGDVPDVDGSVQAAAGQQATISAQRNAGNPARVAAQNSERAPTRSLPHTYGRILTAAGYDRSIFAERHAPDHGLVAG